MTIIITTIIIWTVRLTRILRCKTPSKVVRARQVLIAESVPTVPSGHMLKALGHLEEQENNSLLEHTRHYALFASVSSIAATCTSLPGDLFVT